MAPKLRRRDQRADEPAVEVAGAREQDRENSAPASRVVGKIAEDEQRLGARIAPTMAAKPSEPSSSTSTCSRRPARISHQNVPYGREQRAEGVEREERRGQESRMNVGTGADERLRHLVAVKRQYTTTAV
jgi:hypothetical protein